MTHFFLIIATSFYLTACRPEAAPPVVRTMPAVRTAPIAPVPVPEPALEPEPLSRWSGTPPRAAGLRYELARTPSRWTLSRGDVVIEIAAQALGECVDQLPEPPGPAQMPLSKIVDEPVWLQLIGDNGAASLRLSTRGAHLAIHDGCLRTADMTAALLGTRADDPEDPIFAAATVAPDDAREAADVAMEHLGNTTRLLDGATPWIDVTHFGGESTFSLRALDDYRWARLTISSERESARGDSATGRDHTLVWAYTGSSAPLLVLETDFRFGARGADQEESRTTTTRSHPLPAGLMAAAGERVAIDDARNVGAGRCPEMEGVLAFKHRRETVRWSFTTAQGKAVVIGEAKRRATFASACLGASLAEVSKRPRLLADRADSGEVAWKMAAQTATP